VKLASAVLVGAALLTPPTARGTELEAPTLRLRTAQRIAFSPVEAFFVAELVGGDEVEEFYCPELVWEWGDGSRSVSQSDCPPFGAEGELQRFFTARHLFRFSGNHDVRLILRRADRAVASASVTILVRSRFGD
jgi:hypothetical protein